MAFLVRDAALPALLTVERGYEAVFCAAAFNMAIQEIWGAYDWHWSVAPLPPFCLVPREQDYGAPQVVVPANFERLTKAYYWDISQDQVRPIAKLNITANLGQSVSRDWWPREICYSPAGRTDAGSGSFRIFPRPPDGIGAPYHIIDGEYKKLWSYTDAGGVVRYRLTPGADTAVSLPFGDQHFNVAVEAMKWAFMHLVGDRAAGGTQIQNGVVSHFGQKANMMNAIMGMIEKENTQMGNPVMAPEEPLDYIGNWWGGM